MESMNEKLLKYIDLLREDQLSDDETALLNGVGGIYFYILFFNTNVSELVRSWKGMDDLELVENHELDNEDFYSEDDSDEEQEMVHNLGDDYAEHQDSERNFYKYDLEQMKKIVDMDSRGYSFSTIQHNYTKLTDRNEISR
jgi:hypothetical protein